MASSRFGSSTDDDLEKLLADKDADNTRKSTKAALPCFTQFLLATDRGLNYETPEALNEVLMKFYADARKKDGSMHKLSALKSLRFGLARHYQKELDIDIKKNEQFKKANEIFKAVTVKMKREGLGSVEHTPSLEEDELKKLYNSVAMDINTPCGLQNKVWFDVMFFLCRRGRENLRAMNKTTFAIRKDAQGREYVYQATDELDKNHREGTNSSVTEAHMYAVEGNPLCPVSSFRKYLSKLNPQRADLWQSPVESYDDATDVWYMNQVLGKNTLANLMKIISKRAGLSREFTDHSIRATSITVLDINKFSDRDIMSVSGHRSETSIKNYTGKVTTKRKYEMSNALSTAVINDVQVEDVEFHLSQEHVEVLNMSQEQIDALLAPMESHTTDLDFTSDPIRQPMQSTGMSNTHAISVDVYQEPLKQTVQTLPTVTSNIPNMIDSVLKPIENIPFTPMISNCVVLFNVNLNSK